MLSRRFSPLFDDDWFNNDPFFSWNRQLLNSPSDQHPARSNNSQGNNSSANSLTHWAPLTDVSENEKEFLIHCELPGLKKEDVKIELLDKVLTISGERNYEHKEKNQENKYTRVERSYGKFVRSFSLPPNIDNDKIQAKMQDGVLEINVAKKEQPKSQVKRIDIAH